MIMFCYAVTEENVDPLVAKEIALFVGECDHAALMNGFDALGNAYVYVCAFEPCCTAS